ncbi:GNAT family N-acetyltransferase [Macrococcus armenti]|uniref:GNAT family N-acetyltransferase n=1 Tax=Macrococcus armenti TaxID=2875764 RepID=UPI001CCC3D9B|nr:N-acetyltransferase [Macrococcus armenti]UBH09214.1 GNAT family N-acetyltransferase [Macrococcus armenti]UBH11510.1 GNAT family N-acetyltransferase [Macrococcus armenti]
MSIHILLDSQNVMGMMTCLPIKELKRVTLKKVLVIIKLRKLSALKIILKNPKSLFALMRVREGKENEYHISMIATLPEFQGRGVAKQLIAYAEAISVAEEFNKLSHTVVKQNDTAFNLYRKFGFNVVGEIDDNALQMYRMRKLLTVNRED